MLYMCSFVLIRFQILSNAKVQIVLPLCPPKVKVGWFTFEWNLNSSC